MKDETYFVISNSDGDTTIGEYTKSELLKLLEAKDFGNVFPFTRFPQFPENPDPNYWGDNILIIKGKVVSPKPVETVTKYEIE